MSFIFVFHVAMLTTFRPLDMRRGVTLNNRNETEQKRTERDRTERNETKRNETKRKGTKQNGKQHIAGEPPTSAYDDIPSPDYRNPLRSAPTSFLKNRGLLPKRTGARSPQRHAVHQYSKHVESCLIAYAQRGAITKC